MSESTEMINGIPIEFYNAMKWPDSWRYKPNGDMRQCQCVNDHQGHEGAMSQCHSSRNTGSDLYCSGCEEVHGKAYNAALAEKEAKERT